MKAKKKLAIEKRERRQTGGGKMDSQTSAQTQRIAAMIPSQLESLKNRNSCLMKVT
jgi:hypothetical protein